MPPVSLLSSYTDPLKFLASYAAPGMRKLDSDHPEYRKYKQLFLNGWVHPETPVPTVRGIFLAGKADLKRSFRGRRFDQWRQKYGNGVFEERFHGTTRLCCVGEYQTELSRCDQDGCHVCSILRESFDINKANTGMFGKGIYSTKASSKAHLYTNDNPMSNNRAIIICRVVANRPERLLSADQQKSGVNAGYNSVEGVTKAEGGALNYPETIVYWNDAIIPVGLILYGWDGTPDSDACALM